MVAQHLRYPHNKIMPFAGNAKGDTELQLFGQHLFPKGGKKLYVCEGEVDTLSAYTALGHSWPVVGLAGAQRVDKVFKANMEFLESFDTVVLCFDNDEAGQTATKKALEILSFGTHVLKDFPAECKDVNDILMKRGLGDARTQLMFRTEEYIPDGIKKIDQVLFNEGNFDITLYPWDSVNKKEDVCP
jgi:twinkle protein